MDTTVKNNLQPISITQLKKRISDAYENDPVCKCICKIEVLDYFTDDILNFRYLFDNPGHIVKERTVVEYYTKYYTN